MEIGNPLAGFDPGVIIDKIWFFLGIFLLLAIIGGIGVGMWYIGKKKKGNQNMKEVAWWNEITGTKSMEPARVDKVQELIIPGTTLRVFYCKERDLWLPRFSRGITKNLFYVLLTPTQQMINFNIKGISADLKSAEIEYEPGMLWAAENARDFIKRNYRDKSVKWWQQYAGVITVAAYIIVFTFCLVMIIYFMRGLAQDFGDTARIIAGAVETSCQNAAGSGIAQA